jgi:hypothetical protein
MTHIEELKELFNKKNYIEVGKWLNTLSNFDEIKPVMDYFFKQNGFRQDYLENSDATSYKSLFEQITPFIQKQIIQIGSLNTLFSLDDILNFYILACNENATDLANSVFTDIRNHENNDNTIFKNLLPKLMNEYYYSQGNIRFVESKIKQNRLDLIFLDSIANLNMDLSLAETKLSYHQMEQLLNNTDSSNNVLKKAVEKGLKLSYQSINVPDYMAKKRNPLLFTLSGEFGKDELVQFFKNKEDSGLAYYFKSFLEFIKNLEQMKNGLGKVASDLVITYKINELIHNSRHILADVLTDGEKIKEYRLNSSFDDELLGEVFHQIKYVSTSSWINKTEAHNNLKPYKDIFYFLVDKAFTHTVEASYGTNINSFYLCALNSYLKQNNDQIETNKEINQSVLMTYLSRFSDAIAQEQQSVALIDKKVYSSRMFRIGEIYKTEDSILSHLYRTNKESFFSPIQVELFNNESVVARYNKFAKTHGLSEVSMIETQSKFSKFMNFFSSSKKDKPAISNHTMIDEPIVQENKGYSINYLRMHELLDHPKMDIEVFLNINALYAKSKFLSLVFQDDKFSYIEPQILVKKTFEEYLPQILFNYIQSLNVNTEENFKEQTLEQIKLLSDKILTIETQVKSSQHNDVSTSIAETGEFLRAKLANDNSLDDNIENLKKNSLKIGH